jgi:hypothetical protein
MCDYSLEVYGTQPAREGERYVTTRFPSGTIGLMAPEVPRTAVCLACDTALAIDSIPASLQKAHGLAAQAEGVFTRLETGSYRDGVRFRNGAEVSFQDLGAGCGIRVTNLLEGGFALKDKATEKEMADFGI